MTLVRVQSGCSRISRTSRRSHPAPPPLSAGARPRAPARAAVPGLSGSASRAPTPSGRVPSWWPPTTASSCTSAPRAALSLRRPRCVPLGAHASVRVRVSRSSRRLLQAYAGHCSRTKKCSSSDAPVSPGTTVARSAGHGSGASVGSAASGSNNGTRHGRHTCGNCGKAFSSAAALSRHQELELAVAKQASTSASPANGAGVAADFVDAAAATRAREPGPGAEVSVVLVHAAVCGTCTVRPSNAHPACVRCW